MKFKEKKELQIVSGRASKSDLDKLKANNVNVSDLIREAIARAARSLK
jgi:post-segregation antitoxin (ccd killing protein)